MSIGERIAQKRKEKGLSQEALGELLGVSRQTVYKWESDSALPEVEKLVQLAQHFGVSVGWLLGVEEEKTESGGELDEQQLAMVEQIVQRYLAARPRLSGRRRWALIGAAAALVVIAVFSLFSRLDQIDRRYLNLQNSVNNIVGTVNGQINGIAGQVEELLKEQNQLTAEYGTELQELDYRNGAARFSVYAVPKTFVEGMQAEFIAESAGETVVLPVAEAQQQKFSGEITCPLSDEMKLSVVFLHSDGRRELQRLNTVHNRLRASFPGVQGDVFHIHDREDGDELLTLREVYITTWGEEAGEGGAEIVSLRPGLFLNQRLLGWAEPCETPANFQGFEREQFYALEDMTLEVGAEDELQAAALVTDSYGRSFVICFQRIRFEQSDEGVDIQYVYPGELETYDRDPAAWGLS